MSAEQLSLFELQRLIKSNLDETFGMPVWVKAEISELTVNRSGHCYLDLVETEADTDRVIARCRATIWSYTFRMLKPYFETTTGQVFGEGLKVLFQAKIEYHEVFGMSLNIRDIDPIYTLGDLARQRREIIHRLQEDGVLEMNRELELPPVTQKIAIISSPTAAGYQDFVDQLHNNAHQFVFYTKLFPSVMQGSEAPRSIMHALDRIYEYEDFFDAVVIIRGGGAQIDLACFDQYELAFNVAQFPLPVITGIGHEKDDTVVDLVAHSRLKTPTAVAEFLISGTWQFSQQIDELKNHFTELVADELDQNKTRLKESADELNHVVIQMMNTQRNRLQIAGINLSNRTGTFIKSHQSNLKHISSDLKNLSFRMISGQNFRLDRSANQLNFVFKEQILSKKNLLKQFQQIIKIRISDTFRIENKNLNMALDKLRLIDPQNILKRGYSMTKLNGKIVKSVHQLNPGDRIETRLSDGSIESNVI